jgi:hypothetical protein
MMAALAAAASTLADAEGPSIPPDFMARLLKACARSRGSVLLFKRGEKSMDEREIVPAGRDPLNAIVTSEAGSAAFRSCQLTKPRHVGDINGEIFFNAAPPGAEDLASCFIAPINCDGARFGALLVYGTVGEEPFEEAERDYWAAAASVMALSLHWRGLRRKLAGQRAAAGVK